MTDKELDDTICSKKLKLTRGERFDHYLPISIFLIVPMLIIYDTFHSFFAENDEGVIKASEELGMLLISMSLFFVAFIHKKRGLSFRVVKTALNEDEFKNIALRTARKDKWKIEKLTPNFLSARRSWVWPFSDWSQMITIIRTDEMLLLNSICDLDKTTSITSLGANKRNVNSFLKTILAEKRGEPEQRIVEKKNMPKEDGDEKFENEFTIRRFLIRLVVYPFCLALIVLGIYMIINPVNGKTQGAGIGAISMAIFYLTVDIRLIIQQIKINKGRKHNTTYM